MSDFCYDNDCVYMVRYKSSEEGATTWCFLSCSVGTNYYGIDIEGKPLKEKHKKLLEEMIDRIGGFIERSNPVIKDICNIVEEEAKVYFVGDKTKEETAEIIQNRVKLYVSQNS